MNTLSRVYCNEHDMAFPKFIETAFRLYRRKHGCLPTCVRLHKSREGDVDGVDFHGAAVEYIDRVSPLDVHMEVRDG